jgi:hypothetical protein
MSISAEQSVSNALNAFLRIGAGSEFPVTKPETALPIAASAESTFSSVMM